MCGANDPLNFHHLIPRKLHGKDRFVRMHGRARMRTHGVWICRDHCHPQIHRLIDEKSMGLTYHTLEALLAHEGVAAYVKWRRARLKNN